MTESSMTLRLHLDKRGVDLDGAFPERWPG
jgi:hypothetical protein